MKEIGESLFSIVYLLYGLIIGIYILSKSKNKTTKLLGISTLILILGDSFHLIPRILNNLIDYDFTIYLGIGKLVTSITMTIFYILLYYVYLDNYEVKENRFTTGIIYILSSFRILLCLLPQNNWIIDSSSLGIQIIRNIPFIILGFIIMYLYFNKRKENSNFKYIWFYISLSFMFYIPVILGSSIYPILGMFMIPKTICYMLIFNTFKNKVNMV